MSASLNDEQLLAFNKGDQQAFKTIYEQYSQQLRNFVNGIINDPAETEDIVTELMLKLWRLRGHYETMGNVKAFLFMAARNAALNYLKKKNTHDRVHEEISAIMAGAEKLVWVRVAQNQLLRLIYGEINRLPDKMATILKMYFIGDMSTEDIAVELKMKQQAVRNTKTRGLSRLRDSLLKKGIIREYKTDS